VGSEQFELRCLQRFECQLQVTEATSACLGTISSSSVISNPFLRKSHARTAVTLLEDLKDGVCHRRPTPASRRVGMLQHARSKLSGYGYSCLIFCDLQQKEVEFLHNENQLLEGHLQRVSLS